jgi:hypothetical protein
VIRNTKKLMMFSIWNGPWTWQGAQGTAQHSTAFHKRLDHGLSGAAAAAFLLHKGMKPIPVLTTATLVVTMGLGFRVDTCRT